MQNSIIVLRVMSLSFLVCIMTSRLYSQTSRTKENKKSWTYQCLPCGYDCDKATYDEPGECTSCHMLLVNASSVTFQSIDPSNICNYIKNHPAVILLDVRTKEEFEGRANPDFGTLKNAINIPVQELESRLSSISNFKNKEIVVYCSHSHRSPRASYILTQNGFTNVTNMSGGISVLKDNACKK